ncbi:FecR family protein [Parapedobacter indicus]|uniref:FecR family protein n=2 Tax=Parapedobacter indicus TaxID=1477437 RepID=A0A1I3M5S9_9SPHI|nr:FecR family protein [Parapedobacter indicus]SFI92399.1 FecR family protein [Parapedobacter indicus]
MFSETTMDEQKIVELLRLQRELTTEEKEMLYEWYGQFPEYRHLTFDSLSDKQRIAREMHSKVFEQLPARPRQLWPFVMRIAAVVIAAIALGWWLWPTARKHAPDNARWVEIHADSGGKNKLVKLPDGSNVTLFPGSTVKYSEPFDSGKRQVTIGGLAYFEVVHNSGHPFTVQTAADISTTVLGTTFTVKAFEHNTTVQVGLLSGKVRVDKAGETIDVLDPNEQLIVGTRDNYVHKQPLGSGRGIEWLSGTLVLNDASLHEIAAVIQHVYGLSASFDERATEHMRFNLQTQMDAPITELLEMISLISDLDCHIDKNTVFFELQNL